MTEMQKSNQLSRRDFIKTGSVVAAGLVGTSSVFSSTSGISGSRPVCIFSKCLQFLEYGPMGEVVSNLGFDGVDLTVRNRGHVLPENVEIDLPRALKALGKVGIGVPMIVTGINDANNNISERILGTASDLGIKYYRMGYLQYDQSKSIMQNLDSHKKVMENLEKLNRKYQINGGYQNHSGNAVGAPVWDLYHLLKDIDSEYIGVQYDLMHATVEGANSWQLGFKLLSPWIETLDFKDFIWKQDSSGNWKAQIVPMGEGMVDYGKYFDEIKLFKTDAPVSIHYEYDLGGAEHGAHYPTMAAKDIYQKLKKDLTYLKKSLNH